jgi:hypothetical protein
MEGTVKTQIGLDGIALNNPRDGDGKNRPARNMERDLHAQEPQQTP